MQKQQNKTKVKLLINIRSTKRSHLRAFKQKIDKLITRSKKKPKRAKKTPKKDTRRETTNKKVNNRPAQSLPARRIPRDRTKKARTEERARTPKDQKKQTSNKSRY